MGWVVSGKKGKRETDSGSCDGGIGRSDLVDLNSGGIREGCWRINRSDPD